MVCVIDLRYRFVIKKFIIKKGEVMGLVNKEMKSLLNNVSPDKAFWVHNGPILKNVSELFNALRTMREDTFRHHVNKDKNDFAKWIGDVYGEARLAAQVRTTSTKTALQTVLKKALK